MSERNEWDQLKEEDDVWYGRFLNYLNQGTARSFRQTYENYGYGGIGNRSKVSKTWQKYIRKYRWVDRAAAYDLHVETERRRRHREIADQVYDELFNNAIESAKFVVHSALKDDKMYKKSIAHVKTQIQAAESILDRLGFSKRPPRPIYKDFDDEKENTVNIKLVDIEGMDFENLVDYDDDEPVDY